VTRALSAVWPPAQIAANGRKKDVDISHSAEEAEVVSHATIDPLDVLAGLVLRQRQYNPPNSYMGKIIVTLEHAGCVCKIKPR
jgi:hypothetical protein